MIVLIRRYQRYMVALLAIEQLTSSSGDMRLSSAAIFCRCALVPESVRSIFG